MCVFLTGSGLSLNANNSFTDGSTGGLLSNHQHIYFTGYDVTILECSVISSSLEKPVRSQYSICQSTLEPFISTLCTYLEEKKITHKHKHITGGRAPTSSCTTLAQPPTSLSHCTLGRTLCALGGSWDRAIPSGLCTRLLPWIFSNLSSPLRVLLSVVHWWCKLQPKKKWQVPEIHLFLLLLPLPSSAFYFDLLPFTISSPYIYGCFMARFHPDTKVPRASKSRLVITFSSIFLDASLELGIPFSAASTQQPVPNCYWQHLCNKALLLSASLFGTLSQRAFSKTGSSADQTLAATEQLTGKESLKTFFISPNLIASYSDLFPSLSLWIYISSTDRMQMVGN